jgi:GTPase SAR1 family protein
MLDSRRLKVIFLGDYGVGKTSLIHCKSDGEFQMEAAPTLGIDSVIVPKSTPLIFSF